MGALNKRGTEVLNLPHFQPHAHQAGADYQIASLSKVECPPYSDVLVDADRSPSIGCFQYTEAYGVFLLVNSVYRKCSHLTHCVLCVFWSLI